MGTNDDGFVGSNATRIAGFIAAYADYLVLLTTTHKNPALPIFCAAGPISHQYAPWVQAAMVKAAARGVINTHFIGFDTPVDRCGHPDYTGEFEGGGGGVFDRIDFSLTLTRQTSSRPFGFGPSCLTGHEIMFETASPVIASVLGW